MEAANRDHGKSAVNRAASISSASGVMGRDSIELIPWRKSNLWKLRIPFTGWQFWSDTSTGWPISSRTWVGFTWIWDVPQAVGLYCSCGAAQPRQWNIPNPSQPNPVREDIGHPVQSWSSLSYLDKQDKVAFVFLRSWHIQLFGHIWVVCWHATTAECNRQPSPAPFSLLISHVQRWDSRPSVDLLSVCTCFANILLACITNQDRCDKQNINNIVILSYWTPLHSSNSKFHKHCLRNEALFS